MEDERILFETALLAREKGFLIHCDWRYVESGATYHGFKLGELFNWKDYRVKEATNYDRSYAYKAMEHLESNYKEIFDYKDEGWYVTAPTQSLLTKWLREINGVDVLVQRCVKGYSYQVFYKFGEIDYKSIFQKGWCTSYEKALELGLIEALKLL